MRERERERKRERERERERERGGGGGGRNVRETDRQKNYREKKRGDKQGHVIRWISIECLSSVLLKWRFKMSFKSEKITIKQGQSISNYFIYFFPSTIIHVELEIWKFVPIRIQFFF